MIIYTNSRSFFASKNTWSKLNRKCASAFRNGRFATVRTGFLVWFIRRKNTMRANAAWGRSRRKRLQISFFNITKVRHYSMLYNFQNDCTLENIYNDGVGTFYSMWRRFFYCFPTYPRHSCGHSMQTRASRKRENEMRWPQKMVDARMWNETIS